MPNTSANCPPMPIYRLPSLDQPTPDSASTLADLAGLVERLNALVDENELLGQELLRCYDQLNLVYEISDQVAAFEDPNEIEIEVLTRWARMLGCAPIFVHDGEHCRRLDPPGVDKATCDWDPARVARVLGDEIETCRRRRRTHLPAEPVPALRGGHVLFGVLTRIGTAPRVVVALRPVDLPDFDGRDVLASEAVLGYGGHVLGNLLMLQRLQQTAVETVLALASAIDAKDPYTCGHSERVGWLARRLGAEMGLPTERLQTLEWAGLLHDVGKIGTPEAILNKPGRLTPDEFAEIQRHPQRSYDMLKHAAALAPILPAVLHHHENHDGSGYPHGLAGAAIPLDARIIHVVDIFDALTSDRAYRAGYSFSRALEILADGAGRATDPEVTAVFRALVPRLVADRDGDERGHYAHIILEPDATTHTPTPDAATADSETT